MKRQERFVMEYLVDLNATKAAIRAGYSERSAAAQGCRLLKKPAVQALILERMRAREERTEITQDEVISALREVAFLSFEDPPLFEGRVKVSEKLKALEILGKHLGMFKGEGNGPEGPLPVVITGGDQLED